MSALRNWWHRRPIFWQIFALVVAAVLLTAAAMYLLTWIGPPARPAPTPLESIADGMISGRVQTSHGRPMTIERSGAVPSPQSGEGRAPWLERALKPMLDTDRQAGAGRIVAYTSERPGPLSQAMPSEVRGTVTVGWWQGNNWLVLRSHPSPTETRWLATFIAAVLGVLGLIVALASIVVRSITQPLSTLADAAESARIGQPWSPPLGPATPELRKLAAALSTFDSRQRDHIRQQTTMLAGIAHDLGTPLTRLAFRAESLDEAQRSAASADIGLMRGLIGSSLALARSNMARSEPVDLQGLVHSVVGASRREDAPIAIAASSAVTVTGEPVALQCLVQNLVDNMQRHARGGTIRLWRDERQARLLAEDCGPGFPPELLGQLGSPFVRGEPSRNALTGGNGLGLAIARTIAERHGGGLSLGNRASGGAWVEVALAADM